MVAGDTWPATDPVPYPDEPACAFCIHNYLQTRHGIVTQENLALTQLADDKGVRLRVPLLAVPDPRRNRLARLADRGALSTRAMVRSPAEAFRRAPQEAGASLFRQGPSE